MLSYKLKEIDNVEKDIDQESEKHCYFTSLRKPSARVMSVDKFISPPRSNIPERKTLTRFTHERNFGKGAKRQFLR